MTDARVPMLSADEAREAAEEAGLPAYMADLSVFRVLLRHPTLARALNDLLSTLLFGAALDARLRELVILRIGWRTASVYEWTQHWRVAEGLGVPPEDAEAVRDPDAHPGFGDAERAVLRAVDETLAGGAISAETFEACRKHVGDDRALLELVAAIGNWRMFSSLLRSLEVPLEEGVEPWPPDGREPTAT